MIIAKGDSGATNHYWRKDDRKFLENVKHIQGPEDTLPNNECIKSDQQGQLPISEKLSV